MKKKQRSIKKSIAILLSLLMVLTAVPVSFAEGKAAEESARDKQVEKKAPEKSEEKADKKASQQKEEKEEASVPEEIVTEDPAPQPSEEPKELAEKPEEPQASGTKSEPESEEPVGEDPVQKEQQEKASTTVLKKGASTANSSASPANNDNTLEDGTYAPESFDFRGGTGKAGLSCEKVIIKDGKPTAIFEASSDYMTHVYMGEAPSSNETTVLYDPSTNSRGENVYTIGNKKVSAPVELNIEKPIAARTTSMSVPHWVQYYYKITLSADAEKISDDTTIPENPETPTVPEQNTAGEDKTGGNDSQGVEPTKTKALKDGTYKVKATTCRVMFYLYPKEKNPARVILKKKNGKMTATITLTGDGYDYVYMGTPKQAKKAGKSKWIKGKKKNGFYTFKIPVSALDKKLPITPHSKKYEADGDPSTDPWRPDKWIIIYSAGAKKVKDGAEIKTDKSKKSTRNSNSKSKKNNKKADKVSKWKDDSNKSTSSVNNSTGLKDGVYSPDGFSWSGGSGRLAYIKCNKITVKGGRAFATIEFSSTKYDSLKANGRVYSKQGGGNSTFVIPVKLNANNTIIGRTTAMSQPHWIKYNIYIKKNGGDKANKSKTAEEKKEEKDIEDKKKMAEDAPELMGLENGKAVKIKHAKYFRIFKYDKGMTLITIDQATDNALEKRKEKKASGSGDNEIQYDEDGKPVAKSQNEITDELYNNNVVYYLVVPKGVEVPAGLEKECIIIKRNINRACVMSEMAMNFMQELGKEKEAALLSTDIQEQGGDILWAGTFQKPDYAAMIKAKADISFMPGENILPEKTKEDAKVEESEEFKQLRTLQKRFSALNMPMLIDRSEQEETNYGKAEWIKVYGAIFEEEEKADSNFKQYIKDHKKEKNEEKQ